MDNEKSTTPNENDNLRRDALAMLSAQMQAYERYHAQKENMTWLVALAYVGAAMLLVGREPFWRAWPIQWFAAWIVLLLITAIAVISFLCWQFRNRNRASAFFTCCADVAAQCLHSPITKEELAPVSLPQLSDMLVPAAVQKRFKDRFTGELSWPQTLIMTVVALWTIGAGVYVLLIYRRSVRVVTTDQGAQTELPNPTSIRTGTASLAVADRSSGSLLTQPQQTYYPM